MKDKYSKIEAERLILRPWCADDKAALIDGLNNYNVAKNLLLPYPYTHNDAQCFINRMMQKPLFMKCRTF